MKLWDIIKTANSNLLRNKGRTFLTILAIFIGSFTIILTSGIRTGVNQYIDTQLNSAGGEGYIEIMPKSTGSALSSGFGGSGSPQEYNPNANSLGMTVMSDSDMQKLRDIPGIQSLRPAQQISAEYIASSKTTSKFVVTPQALPSDRITLDVATGKIININGSQPEINLLPGYAKALGFYSDEAAIGQTVKIGVSERATSQIHEVDAVVAGVMNKSIINLGRSWVNTSLENEILDVMYKGLPDSYRNRVYSATAEWDTSLGTAGLDKIKNQMSDLGFTGMTFEDQVGMFKTFLDAIILVFTIFGGVALLAASIGIINTLFMAVQERTREIGLSKAMGLGKGKIFLMFSVEAIALGFWGSALGIGVAYLVRAFINPLAAHTFLKDLPGFNLLQFDLKWLVGLVLLVMLIAFVAGTLPARRASKQNPIDALRYE